jgi:hypothetical protein
MRSMKRRNNEGLALYYLAGGFIVGCIVGRASSSVDLSELPSRKQAMDTYEGAVDVIKDLIARAR